MPNKTWAYDVAFYDDYLSFRSDLDKIRAEATKKDVEEIRAIAENGMESTEALYYIENGNAHIPVLGSLTNRLDICASIFGVEQTLYSTIIEQTRLANEDLDVDKIVYDIDSPGGSVAGVELAAEAIRASEKPTEAHVYNMAASAAYWLASQTDTIMAADRTVRVGSIGVVVEYIDRSKADEKSGIRRRSITSTGAPDKRIDLETKEGESKLRAQLDDIHKVFVETVAAGRGTTPADVQKNFGQGGMLISEKAIKAGMIDGILIEGATIKRNPPRETGEENISEEVQNMDKAKLKAEFPDLYNEIVEEGKASVDVKASNEAAVKEDRERMQEIFSAAGIKGHAVECAMNGMDAGAWALDEKKKETAAREKGESGIKALEAKGQIPKDHDVEGSEEVSAAQKKLDEAIDGIVGKKEAK